MAQAMLDLDTLGRNLRGGSLASYRKEDLVGVCKHHGINVKSKDTKKQIANRILDVIDGMRTEHELLTIQGELLRKLQNHMTPVVWDDFFRTISAEIYQRDLRKRVAEIERMAESLNLLN